MAVKTTFTIEEPKKLVSTTGIHRDIFNDDLKFTFEAKDFHATDPKEVASVFADLDFAVLEVKKAWGKGSR